MLQGGQERKFHAKYYLTWVGTKRASQDLADRTGTTSESTGSLKSARGNIFNTFDMLGLQLNFDPHQFVLHSPI
jgi:hypothetical protein